MLTEMILCPVLKFLGGTRRQRFKDGREHVEDEERSGRPSTSKTDENVKRVKAVLDSDRRASVRLIADEVGLPKSDVHRIISEDLHMRKVCAKLVPKVLTEEQKNLRVTICDDLCDSVESESDLMDFVITGDETWVFQYDPESKRQSSEWHTTESPRPKKARMSKSKIKTMLIVFFSSKEIVHKEFVPAETTVNAIFYKTVLERLVKRVARARPDIVDRWRLHHDNAPAHTALLMKDFLAKKNVATLPHPPYSPDLSPLLFVSKNEEGSERSTF